MSFISGLDYTRNYSLFTIPAAFLLYMLPGPYAYSLADPSFDPVSPRQLKTTFFLSDDSNKLEKAHKQRLKRAHSAMQNGFETLGLYAAGVTAASHAGVESQNCSMLLTVG
ncbi:hypothetical protein TgHK011_006677 [Trichoderma gracile]|nr:hypothetical protein TgHK011_006677 [Trichoderma gracile]